MGRAGSDASKSDREWLRHPLFVSAFSILLGSVGVGLLQNSLSNRRALREKRYAVADNLVRYMGQAGTTLRLYDLVLDDAQRRKEFPMKSERFFPVQQSLNSTFAMQNRLEAELAFYFTSEKPLAAFQEFRKVFGEAVNSAETARKSGKYVPQSVMDYQAGISRKADNCICALKDDLPINEVGAGRCHEEMRQ